MFVVLTLFKRLWFFNLLDPFDLQYVLVVPLIFHFSERGNAQFANVVHFLILIRLFQFDEELPGRSMRWADGENKVDPDVLIDELILEITFEGVGLAARPLGERGRGQFLIFAGGTGCGTVLSEDEMPRFLHESVWWDKSVKNNDKVGQM